MRFHLKKLYTGRLPVRQFFLAGLLLGILVMNFGKGFLLENTGLLDEYVLYHMKYMTVDSRALFIYVLGKRITVLVFLLIIATTYLGLAAVCALSGWYGMLLGMFLSTAMLRYGLKGILLSVVSLFPHSLFYVPALIALMACCEHICRSVYFKGGSLYLEEGKKSIVPPEKIIQLLLVLAAVVIGSFLESYLNPHLLLGLLKIF